MLDTVRSALHDVSTGMRLHRVWLALAHEDIGDQHRRTLLGPLWLLVNYLIYMATFYAIFGSSTQIPHFLPYCGIGLLIFLFFQEVLVQSVSLFSREESLIQGTTLPLTVYVLRLLAQSTIRTGYAAVGCLAIVFFSGILPTTQWLWAAAGIILIILTLPAATIAFSVVGAFFPDMQFIISNLVRVSLFLTPIFWTHAGGLRGVLYQWNPFTHFIEIVRIPILYGHPPTSSLVVAVLMALVMWMLAVVLLGTFRKDIVFVL